MKNYLITILFLLIACLASGQSFNGGITVGTTISQVDGDNFGGYHKISPLGGVYVRNTFNKNWGASVGIEYKRKGSKEVQKDDYGHVVFFYAMNMDYIEVPFILNYKLDKIGIPGLFERKLKSDFLLEFGLSGSYLIKGSEDFGDGPIPPPTRPMKKYEVANHIGLNYYLSEHWVAYWRFSYTFPLLPVREHPGGQVYWFNRGQYNHNMSFAIKYEF